ncbi:hypothetical protein E2C01_022515 [Portunus trituberculatus]|uniref:Uncharacterized protein n=1 Tax=Portunus trituberculatus TaxID=210409 RepID=A0A5B7E5L1_PORTR|nr:hypothetical protein [Portunus trituberculatus]
MLINITGNLFNRAESLRGLHQNTANRVITMNLTLFTTTFLKKKTRKVTRFCVIPRCAGTRSGISVTVRLQQAFLPPLCF